MGDLDSIVLRSSLDDFGSMAGGSDSGVDAFAPASPAGAGSSGGGGDVGGPGSPSSGMYGTAWRIAGQKKRAEMLREDETSGGSTFNLNKRVSVRKYYEVSHRALLQFRDACEVENGNLDETYLMGNRLVKFISAVLPTHPEYGSSDPDLVELRDEVKSKLLEAGTLLSDVALQIDKIEHSAYILSDLGHRSNDGGAGDDCCGNDEAFAFGGGGSGTADAGSGSHSSTDPSTSLLNTSASSISSAEEQVSAAQSDFAAWEVDFDESEVDGGGGGWANFESWHEESVIETSTTHHVHFASTTTQTTRTSPRQHQPPVPSILASSPRSNISPKHKKDRALKVSFADDVKPGHDHCVEVSTSLDVSLTTATEDDNNSSNDLDVSKTSSVLLEEELEWEHQTFLRMTQEEFSSGEGDGDGSSSSGSGTNSADENDNGEEVAEREDIHCSKSENYGQRSELPPQDFSRVVKYDTDEVDDVPSDESDSDDAAEDEFANAPVNDVSGSTNGDRSVDEFLQDFLPDDDDEDEDETPGLSFVQKVALENIMKDKSAFEEEDSDAEDSWAQEEEDDGNGAEEDDLGFDGPLPTFPTDGKDPFFEDQDAPWPDDVYALGSDFVATSSPAKDDPCASVSGTDETAPSSQASYDLDCPTKRTGANDESVPDRLNYLESKLKALQDRNHLNGMCSNLTLREDEVEL